VPASGVPQTLRQPAAHHGADYSASIIKPKQLGQPATHCGAGYDMRIGPRVLRKPAIHRGAGYDVHIRNLQIEVHLEDVPKLSVRVLNRLARTSSLKKKVNISQRNGRTARDVRCDVIAAWPEGNNCIKLIPNKA